MICKYCNKNISNIGSHSRVCDQYISYIDKVKEEIHKKYSNGENIDGLTKIFGISRNVIERVLTSHGVDIKSYNHKRHCQIAKHKKLKKTMIERYGVENYGQLHNCGYVALNKRPYTKPKFYNEFQKYRAEVEKITKLNIKKMTIPSECYITGITFADELNKEVNPNDWYKRSIDHKRSILDCYLNNIETYIAGGVDNIIFVLKYVNNIKGNMPIDVFEKIYKDKLLNILNEN